MRRRSRTRSLAAAGLAGAVVLSGCAGLSGDPALHTLQEEHSQPIRIDGIPHYAQDQYQCGPAALASVLTWSGETLTPDDLRDSLYIPAREGTLQPEIVSGARRHGRIPYRLRGGLAGLLSELDAGHPVLVLENLGLGWSPVWHYSVVYGFDPAAGRLQLRSGTESSREVSLDTFRRTWGRAGQWALVVLPPGRLLATGSADSVLEAAAPFEELGQIASAHAAYRAASTRWPDSAPVHFALGNTEYAQGNHAEAETAWRRAAALDPGHGAAWNNLALVLADRQQWDDALEAAATAVRLGGPFDKAFADTLEQIRTRRAATAKTKR